MAYQLKLGREIGVIGTHQIAPSFYSVSSGQNKPQVKTLLTKLVFHNVTNRHATVTSPKKEVIKKVKRFCIVFFQF